MVEVLAAIGRYGLSLCWQVAAVVTLAWAIAALLGRGWASCRYRLWLLVLARLCFPAVVVTPIGLLPHGTPEALTTGLPALVTAPPVADRPEARPSTAPPRRPDLQTVPGITLVPLLTLCWVTGVGALSLGNVLRHRRLLREIGAASAPGARLAGFVERARGEIGLAAPVRVRLMPPTASEQGPALVGLVRPTVIVPELFDDQWQESVHGPLLLHELVHLRRLDHWLNLAVTAMRIAYFFHPAVWVATSCLIRERERVCDDAVVRHYGASPRLYVQALCRHALALSPRRPNPLAASLVQKRSDLVRRIDRLSAPGTHQAGKLAAAAVVSIGVLVLALAAGRAAASGKGRETPSTEASPEVEQLARELELALTETKDWTAGAEVALVLAREHPTMPTEVGDLAANALLGSDLEIEARAAFLSYSQRRPDDPAALRNAATFLQWTDPKPAEALLERGQALEPAEWWWPAGLGLLRQRRALHEPADEAPVSLEAARVDLTRALELGPPALERTWLLGRAARAALDTGWIAQAETLAEEELAEAPAVAGTWLFGNALHESRLTLGEVALLRGDVEQAAEWLVSAADVPGSPQLATFGPGTALAEKLLRLGVSEPVLRYLEACGELWEHDHGRLEAWATEIRAGRIPDFGSNRFYP